MSITTSRNWSPVDNQPVYLLLYNNTIVDIHTDREVFLSNADLEILAKQNKDKQYPIYQVIKTDSADIYTLISLFASEFASNSFIHRSLSLSFIENNSDTNLNYTPESYELLSNEVYNILKSIGCLCLSVWNKLDETDQYSLIAELYQYRNTTRALLNKADTLMSISHIGNTLRSFYTELNKKYNK
jgi:hypothetical protein